MLTIGLSGQSGAGKGEFSRIFKRLDGVYCLDTDVTAREVVEKGEPCLERLYEYFGSEILLPDGNLDRKKLAQIAFTDDEKHQKLNEITHFYIMEKVKKWLFDVEKDGAKVAIIDAPLLFESGADKLCDITIGVTAPYATRLKRIMRRDGIDKKNAKIRLDSQPKDEFFEENCTYTLANNGSLASLEKKAKVLIDSVLSQHIPER